MGFYAVALILLVAVNATIAYFRRRTFLQADVGSPGSDEHPEEEGLFEKSTATAQQHQVQIQNLQRRYFPVYILAVAADWLQGPYIYTVYSNVHGVSDRLVALLFITGFGCGAVSSTLVGQLSDKYGRKKACIAYCVIYSLSSITVVFDSLPILFLGRALGGLSTTLLYSAFESWLVSDFNASVTGSESIQELSKNLFGMTALLNSLVAILSGILSQALVSYTGTETAPFLASMVCLYLAMQLILKNWSENFGDPEPKAEDGPAKSWQTFAEDKATNSNIIVLCLITSIFEGSMYIFIHYWPQAIIAARAAAQTAGDTPFGAIFASMMCAMTLGSFVFQIWFGKKPNIATVVDIIQFAVGFCGIGLVTASIWYHEYSRFLSFLIFETCVGMYFPAMASLKAHVVSDGVRGRVYSMMRLGLNVFVLVTLGTTKGEDSSRDLRFFLCSVLLLAMLAAVRFRLKIDTSAPRATA